MNQFYRMILIASFRIEKSGFLSQAIQSLMRSCQILKPAVLLLLLTSAYLPCWAQQGNKAELITGDWMAAKKNLIVQVYRNGAEYDARIRWFNDSDDPREPMAKRQDIHNQQPELRKRTILGLQVVRNLEYNKQTGTWENGIIYDSRTGKEWSSYAYLDDNGILKVKGYWHFKFLCQTMDFYRISPDEAAKALNQGKTVQR